MPKPEIHPKWSDKTPVLCDGKLLCYVESTQATLPIDIWLVNHPFYSKSQVMIDSEGRVEKFMKKYQLDSSSQ
jgi:large subunit ribosomal protein L31